MSATLYRVGWVSGLLALMLLWGCSEFNNPVELEPDGDTGPQGAVTVEIGGIDSGATILVVELVWAEAGTTGENTLRKTVALDGNFPELSFTFDGLGQGGGYARAGTYVGAQTWQTAQQSPNLQMEEGGSLTTAISLATPDGDVDFDPDFDPWIPDGDIPDGDTPDGDTPDGDSDGDADGDLDSDPEPDTEIDPALIIDVPYTPDSTDLNGRLNVKDSEEQWGEWSAAEMVVIQTGLATPVTVYIMQDSTYLLIGANIPSLTSPDETQDRLQLALDPSPNNPGDEFILEMWRDQNNRTCIPVSGTTCADLPNGQPTWGGAFSENFDGWQVEIGIKYEGLGLVAGTAKTLGFAIFNIDNGQTSPWPAGTGDAGDISSWGRLISTDLWDVAVEPDGDVIDGDDDSDGDTIDGDADGDAIDGDADADADSDGDVIDGDVDDDSVDGDEDGDLVDGDDDPDGISCTPAQISCQLQGSVWHAVTCNANGDGYVNDTTCVDYEQCTQDTCLDGLGCYYPNDDGRACNDGLNCTENDQCSGGDCHGDAIICEQRACQTSSQNPANSECCEYQPVTNGIGCDDGYSCSDAYCDNGSCVTDWIAGCCEGFEDMTRIEVGGRDYCIDVYEAAIGDQDFLFSGCDPTGIGLRYGDFSDNYPGGFGDTVTTGTQSVELYACNADGVMPSRYLTWFQAQTACANVGKRLCTRLEFQLACGGEDDQSYPYGASYESGTCNGTGGLGSAEVSGYYTDCERFGVYDLSGNLAEWAEEETIQGYVCGGSYSDGEAGLTCSSCVADSQTESRAWRGFRCCAEMRVK